MDTYEKKYKEALERAKSFELPEYKNIMASVFPELKESEDEKIKNRILFSLQKDIMATKNSGCNTKELEECVAWLEKQGEKPKKVSIWKHWKDGIAGNGEGEPIYLIKYGYTYSLSSCLCFECDYIELSELEKILSEKQGEKKISYTTTVETGDGGINALVTRYIEIPFGAKDSELQEVSYHIPEGFHAEIEGDKVTIKQGEKKSLKVYRVENEAEEKGLWRKFDGTWQPLFDMLTDGKCKDMPMEDNPIYREGGKRWFASAPSKETLREWFSERDLEELVSKGFTITEFEVTEYKKVSDFEYIFTRDSIINKIYLKVSDIYSEQKPDDKVKPKFKVGDWINGYYTNYKVLSVNNEGYVVKDVDGNKINILFENEKFHHLWTIKDAKKGDVLVVPPIKGSEHSEQIFIFKEIKDREYVKNAVEYYCRCMDNEFASNERGFMGQSDDYFIPATKEQRDTLFKAMHEAGYMWDSESKQLLSLKAEPIPAELAKGEDYGIDGLWHAQRILEKTFGKVDGYQTDDGILSHECAISAVKELYEKKPAWSEEDEDIINGLINSLTRISLNTRTDSTSPNYSFYKEIDWLKSLRPQPKQEWSEEDKVKINRIVACLENLNVADNDILLKDIEWLKSLKERINV